MATLRKLTREEWQAKYGPIFSTIMFFVKEKPEWMKVAAEKQRQAGKAKKLRLRKSKT